VSASAKMESRIGPKQTRPRINTCGTCGSEVAKGTLICDECLYEIVSLPETQREAR
jgi:hypothetical protein